MRDDEQTRLLQQILDVQTEHLELSKQRWLEAKEAEERLLESQNANVRIGRTALRWLYFALALLAAIIAMAALPIVIRIIPL